MHKPTVDSSRAAASRPQAAPSQTESPKSESWWTPTAGGHELHVAELRPAVSAPHGAAVVLFHGLFSDGRFFLGRKGPASVFLNEGFTVYAADFRGHGKSRRPATSRALDWGFDAYAREDIPAVVKAVAKRHRGPVFLMAHSMAGYAALAGLALDAEAQGSLRGVAVASSAVNDFSDGGLKKVLLVRGSSLVARLVGRFPAKALRQGPSDEPARLMREFSKWARTGAFSSADGIDYWTALGRLTVPVLSLIGESDRFHASPTRAKKLFDHLGSADKSLVVCGRSTGFGADFGHFDIVRSAQAEREVLPKIASWMRERARVA